MYFELGLDQFEKCNALDIQMLSYKAELSHLSEGCSSLSDVKK